MIVTVDRAQRPYADISDLTTKEVLRRGWVTDAEGVERYELQFAVNLTAAEVEAVRRRLATDTAIAETLHARAVAAYQDLTIYEQLAAPTNAQTVAVVKLLCKVTRALIRLQLRRLDAAD